MSRICIVRSRPRPAARSGRFQLWCLHRNESQPATCNPAFRATRAADLVVAATLTVAPGVSARLAAR